MLLGTVQLQPLRTHSSWPNSFDAIFMRMADRCMTKVLRDLKVRQFGKRDAGGACLSAMDAG
eukprot:3057067-Amphidinium_carterae.1